MLGFSLERALWLFLFVKKNQKFLENFRSISKNQIPRAELSQSTIMSMCLFFFRTVYETLFHKGAARLCVSVLCPAALVGLTNDNPAAPNLPEFGLISSRTSVVTWKMGYNWEEIFRKRVEVIGAKTGEESHLYWRKARSAFQSHLALVALTVSDRIEVYGAAGSMKLKLSASSLDGRRIRLKTPWSFTGGIGGRALLIYWDRAMMGVHARYQRAHLGVEDYAPEGEGRGSSHFTYNEWEVGLSVTGEIKWFYPYIGLAYYGEQSRLHLRNLSCGLKVKNKQPFVFLVGFSCSAEKGGAFTVEGRLLGEQAIAVTGSLRF